MKERLVLQIGDWVMWTTAGGVLRGGECVAIVPPGVDAGAVAVNLDSSKFKFQDLGRPSDPREQESYLIAQPLRLGEEKRIVTCPKVGRLTKAASKP